MGEQAEEKKHQKPTKHICAGLLAHVDAGKTTLTENLLYTGGAIAEPGRAGGFHRPYGRAAEPVLSLYRPVGDAPPHRQWDAVREQGLPVCLTELKGYQPALGEPVFQNSL